MERRTFTEEDGSYALWLLLIQANKAIHLARQEELDRIGITVAEAGILYYAEKLGNRATPAEISRRLSKVSHGISVIIKRLENQGLVTKVRDLERKNQVRVELTEKGRQAHQKAIKRETIHQIMASLCDEDFNKITSCLEQLRNTAFERITFRKKLVYLGYEE